MAKLHYSFSLRDLFFKFLYNFFDDGASEGIRTLDIGHHKAAL